MGSRMARTMNKTTPPMKRIIIGSMMLLSAVTADSTSLS